MVIQNVNHLKSKILPYVIKYFLEVDPSKIIPCESAEF